MPEVRLDAADAAELAEMLQFLSQALARDHARLAASLAEFVGHPAYGLDELRGDLDRFVSCSAATTVSLSSAQRRNSPHSSESVSARHLPTRCASSNLRPF